MILQNPMASRLASAAVRRAISPGAQVRLRKRSHSLLCQQREVTPSILDAGVKYTAQYRLLPLSNGGDLSSSPCLGESSAPSIVYLNAEFGPSVSGASLQCRLLHTSQLWREAKPSSKVEETVIRLKEKTEEGTAKEEPVGEKERQSTTTAATISEKEKPVAVAEKPTSPSPPPAKAVIDESSAPVSTVPKKSLWVRFKDEVNHYVSGFKLLFLDIKVSSKIIWKVLQGKVLTRRENKQLVRTVSDLFRIVPFSVFVIVPFMEFLLPVALKLFPGMLPSTFTTSSERDNKMRRTLKAKLEYAKFLQKTLDEMGPTSQKSRTSKSASDFVEFYKGVKELKVKPTNQDIMKFSKLFEDEITLDNMTRGQLVALCKLLELTPLGTSNFLRFQLEMKVRQLRTDDRVIQREGLDNLNVTELQTACKERGMRAIGMSEKAMKEQLSHWLDLSLNSSIPTSLLLLSRTLYLPENLPSEMQIAATISALPESAATQTTATIGEREGKIRNVVRLEVIKEEQRKIEEEEKEVRATEEAKKEEEEAAKKAAAEAVAGGVEKMVEDAAEPLKKIITPVPPKDPEVLVDKAPVMVDTAVELDSGAAVKDEAAKKEAEISTEDLSDLKSAIEVLEKTGKTETDEIESLKKELQDYEEDLQELSEIKAKVERTDLSETKGAARLFGKVNKMLNNVDSLVANLREQEKQIEESMKVQQEEASSSDEAEQQKLVTIHELIQAVTMLQATPDESRLEQIAEVLSKMDEDADGVIKVDHVLKVIELLGREHVKLSGKQINQIIEMLQKEEMLAIESNIEKLMTEAPNDAGVDEKGASIADSTSQTQESIPSSKADAVVSSAKEDKMAEGKTAAK